MSKLFLKKDIRITLIGAGKLACSLVPALLDKNYKISSIYDIHLESAADIALKYNIKNYSDALFNFDPDSNIFILAVPDGEIKKVVGLLSLLNIEFKKTLFIHTSGSRNISVMNSLKEEGALTASLHLMQTFPGRKKLSLKGSYAAVETDNAEVNEFLTALATELELLPVSIGPEEKVYYHLLGVLASNFLAANMFCAEISNELMSNPIPDLFKLLKPIVTSTYSNIAKLGATEALSGPIERGDFETIEMHVNALSNNYELQFHYVTTSITLLEVVHSKGDIPSREYGKIKLFLTAKLKELAQQL